MRRYLMAGVGLALLLGVAFAFGRRSAPEQEGVVVDSASASAFANERTRLQEEVSAREGVIARLRATVRGLEARPPRTRTVYDTLIRLDTITVLLSAQVEGGALTLLAAPPALLSDTFPHARQPIALSGIDVGDCDDGFTIVGTQVACDRARFGHLGAFTSMAATSGLEPAWGGIGAWAEAGAVWQGCFRCTWEVSLSVATDERIRLTVRKRLWLF